MTEDPFLEYVREMLALSVVQLVHHVADFNGPNPPEQIPMRSPGETVDAVHAVLGEIRDALDDNLPHYGLRGFMPSMNGGAHG